MLKRLLNLTGWNLKTLPSIMMSLRAALILLVLDMLLGVLFFVLFEGYSLPEAFFWVVITPPPGG